MTANNMNQLNNMLMKELRKAMTVASDKMLADMYGETGKFYTKGNPKIYKRTGALGDTPKTSPLTSSLTSVGGVVSFNAYLDQTHQYTTGTFTRGLHSDMTITLDVSDLTTAKEKSDALDSTIKQMQDLKTKVGVDSEEVEYANSIISYCITQKQQLSEPAILDVDVSKVSETTGEAVLLIQDFQKACNDLELKKALGLDTTDAQAKVDELYSQITSSDNDALLALKLDTTSVETVKSSIAGLTIDDIKTKLQIDDTALLSYQPEDKQATVTYDVDTTKVDNYNPKNLSRTVTYYVRTVGSVKANGTANLTGTAIRTSLGTLTDCSVKSIYQLPTVTMKSS